MSTGPVDNKGNYLHFTDTGPVPGSAEYTTLIIFHGLAFTGAIFQKLNPFGAASDVRIVTVNRRDYPGSTQYSDSEVTDVDAGRGVHLERLGLETAHFLTWFAHNHDIPKISPDGKRGGFSVLGWSLGGLIPLAVLGYPHAFQNDSFRALEPYFRQAILYDPPHLALGYPAIPGGYTPLTDPTFATPQIMMEHFGPWVSGHYRHANISSHSIGDLDNSHIGTNPSIENMTPLEFSENVSFSSAFRTEFSIMSVMQPAISAQCQEALFSKSMAQSVFPQTKVIYLWCTESIWPCVYANYETVRRYEDCSQDDRAREIRFMALEGNHFVHWDDPVGFWAVLVDAIHDKPQATIGKTMSSGESPLGSTELQNVLSNSRL